MKVVKHRMRVAKQKSLDPLYVIFEQHLYHFHDAELDRQTLIQRILQDYFLFLRRKNIQIPKSLEAPIVEELSHQVHIMLVKKIYGFPSIQEYQEKASAGAKRQARTRYSKLKK